MIIGIAGKYCAGKDTFVEILESYGFYEINADKTGHTVLNQLKTEIVDAFDKKILSPSGEIDRRALGKIVFKKAKYRRKLESIIHPEMIKQIKSQLGTMVSPGGNMKRVVINAAILFRMELHKVCDLVILISAPLLTRLKRAMARDKLSLWQTLKRLYFQGKIYPKFRTEDVDIYFVRNRGKIESLKKKGEEILKKKGVIPEA